MTTFDDWPEDEPALLEQFPTLAAVAQFTKMIRGVSWFGAVGDPLGAVERQDAADYAAALGFPQAMVATVADWDEAEAAARNPEWNTDWWEAEEQLRAALTAAALDMVGDQETLMATLTTVTGTASEVVHAAAGRAAGRHDVADQALIRAAAGAATQASYQAALVLAAGAEADHAFAVKFRLFEAGRWPLGIIGMTLSLF